MLLIIPKSEPMAPFPLLLFRKPLRRILLASIRNLGRRPCPRCLVPLDRTHLLGSEYDMRTRQERPRNWDHQHQFDLETVRRFIYESNMQVNSSAVEKLLYEDSLVPTVVTHAKYSHCLRTYYTTRIHSTSNFLLWDSIHMLCS
jgi:hypothetical protein